MKDGLKILVGVDGSEHSTWAFLEAVNIARRFSGSVKVIIVSKLGMEEEAERIKLKVKQLVDCKDVECEVTTLIGSNPSRALVRTAERENFDLIVVGSRGLGNVASFLLGSVSRQVVTKASCNVLVVKK
jgi:nucleotide-binding universal stress UspA family protein